MKVESSADWRKRIPFETAVVVAEVVPGEPTRCFACGTAAEPLDRSELWAFKHRHPNHHDGFVRFYCRPHVPVVTRPEPVVSAPSKRSSPRRSTGERTTAPRRTVPEEKPRAMCTDCFVEVAATGICGMCGKPA
ncbi:glucose-6-phosphate dehydrogenase [Microbacterium koreense]|uniref:Glucose-6-phosphate dehydrogenase n=1 Tax=Microbacterium koreense TaxID=323761 RepID=A0ABW2ZQL5_9MICO